MTTIELRDLLASPNVFDRRRGIAEVWACIRRVTLQHIKANLPGRNDDASVVAARKAVANLVYRKLYAAIDELAVADQPVEVALRFSFLAITHHFRASEQPLEWPVVAAFPGDDQ